MEWKAKEITLSYKGEEGTLRVTPRPGRFSVEVEYRGTLFSEEVRASELTATMSKAAHEFELYVAAWEALFNFSDADAKLAEAIARLEEDIQFELDSEKRVE